MEELKETAIDAVIDNTSNPKSLLVENETWNALLSKFKTGQKVKVIIYGQD